MRKQITEEVKLKLLEQSGCCHIVKDVVALIVSDIGDEVDTGTTGIEMYSQRLIERLRKKYKMAIQVQQICSKQIDLEDSIREIREEEEQRKLKQIEK